MQYNTSFHSNLEFSRALSGPEVINFMKLNTPGFPPKYQLKDDAKGFYIILNETVKRNDLETILNKLVCFVKTVNDSLPNIGNFTINGELLEVIEFEEFELILSWFKFQENNFKRCHQLDSL